MNAEPGEESLGVSYRKPRCLPIPDRTIALRQLIIERKTFTIALKENYRGRFVRITEASSGRYTNIVIPASGLEEFSNVVLTLERVNSQDDAEQAR
jgi:hypothetical protein